MIHLKKVSTVFSISVQKSHKFPHSTSKLLRGLFRAEYKSSVSQLIPFLNEEGLKESRINADDTIREVKKVLSNISKSTENVDADSRFGLNADTSVETFRKFVKEANTKKVGIAMEIMRYLWVFLKCIRFPIQHLGKYSDVNSFFSVNEFQEVFETIEKNLRYLTNRELLIVFDVCTIFKVSANSSLMQKVIKLLSSDINSMSSLDVIHIYCVIQKYYIGASPQIAAFSVACRELLNNCFESNFNPNSNPRLMSMYVTLEYLPQHVREFLLMKLFQSNYNLFFSSYSYILKGLLLPGVFKHCQKFHKNYIDHVLRKLQENFDSDYSNFSLFYFSKLYLNAVRRGLIAYDEDFFDLLALRFVKWKPPLPIMVESCRRFFRAGHFSAALFDCITSEAMKLLNSDQFKTLKDIHFFFLTELLSTAGKQNTKILNYFYRERLVASWSHFPKFENNIRIRLPLSLAVLGIYEDRLIENCFTSKNGGELTEDDLKGLNDSDLNSLLLLHQAIVTFHPSYPKPLLSEELLKKLSKSNFLMNQKSSTWLETVQLCFGGSNFVMKNCTTPLHHNLSYVVVLDKNNVPIDVESIQRTNTQTTDERFNIDDIPASEETQVIVFQEVWPETQVAFRNVSSWKGTFQLYMDVLEVYCKGVIPLLTSDFTSLQKFERVPFLLNKIEKKFGVIGKPMSPESESDNVEFRGS